MKEVGMKEFATTDTQSSERSTSEGSIKRRSIIDRIMKKQESVQKRIMSLEEKRQYASSIDAAAYFGQMIRANFAKEMNESNRSQDEETEVDAPKYSAPSKEVNTGSLEPCTVAENEGGEEDIRAALTCFFLYCMEIWECTYPNQMARFGLTDESICCERNKRERKRTHLHSLYSESLALAQCSQTSSTKGYQIWYR